MNYLLYGCRVEAPLPVGVPLSFSEGVDTQIKMQGTVLSACDAGFLVYQSNLLTVRRTDAGHRFTYSDETEFFVSRDGEQVLACTPASATLEDTCTYLVGPIMGFILRLRGVVCLHASTLVINGNAVCFCGPPGAGKSTTAAALAQRGCAVLAEDIGALDDHGNSFRVQPGYPRVNLWPESAAALCGSADALPIITPNWDKRYMPLDTGGPKFHSRPAPLSAIYILSDRLEQCDPEFQSLHSLDALVALASNTYTPYLLDEKMRGREFDVLTRLVKYVPIRRVYPPVDFANIDRFCAGIVRDIEALL